MSLWKPYADDADVPLDLTKTAAQVPQPQPQLPAPTKYPPYSGYFEQGHVSPGGWSAVSPTYDPVSYAPAPPPPRHVTASQLESITEAVKPLHLVDDTLSDDPDFIEFERDALRVMAETDSGALLGNNPRMRRAVRSSHSHAADDAYRRQRERNNVAAKLSRDRRKMREIHLGLQATYLKKRLAALKAALGTTVCGRCQQSCLC